MVCLQNHDQIGNRAEGDRLRYLISFRDAKLAATLLLLQPSVPLLFMGEELGLMDPFLYFVDHGDPDLNKAVFQGRKNEMGCFGWTETPEPSAKETFEKSKIDWDKLKIKNNEQFFCLYQDLIYIRKELQKAGLLKREILEVVNDEEKKQLILHYSNKSERASLYLNFSGEEQTFDLGNKTIKFHSESVRYGGALGDLSPSLLPYAAILVCSE